MCTWWKMVNKMFGKRARVHKHICIRAKWSTFGKFISHQRPRFIRSGNVNKKKTNEWHFPYLFKFKSMKRNDFNYGKCVYVCVRANVWVDEWIELEIKRLNFVENEQSLKINEKNISLIRKINLRQQKQHWCNRWTHFPGTMLNMVGNCQLPTKRIE